MFLKMKNKPVYSLIRSFKYAFRGILYCILNERNMRIHTTMAVVIAYFTFYFNLTVTEQSLVFLAVALVIVCEMLNTAIETVINFCAPYYNNCAKVVKDIAAGAVLVAAFFSAFVGLRMFLRIDIWLKWIDEVLLTPGGAVITLLSAVVALIFIFIGPKQIYDTIYAKIKTSNNKK